MIPDFRIAASGLNQDLGSSNSGVGGETKSGDRVILTFTFSKSEVSNSIFATPDLVTKLFPKGSVIDPDALPLRYW